MDDLLKDLVCVICFDAKCWAEICCAICQLLSPNCIEDIGSCVCRCCCHMTRICCFICVDSYTGDFVCPTHHCGCRCRWSCAIICLWLLATYCGVLGSLCLVAFSQHREHECGAPIDLHVLVQGILMFGNAFTLIYVCVRYYMPRFAHLPFGNKTAFSRFHLLFSKHLPLTFFIGVSSLGFWWSIFGYYWISKVHCPDSARFLLAMDHIVIASEFVMGVALLVLVYSIVTLVACDEGSCRFEKYKQDCFVCCCGCCLKTSPDHEEARKASARHSRTEYPKERNECIAFSVSVVKGFGCLRSESEEAVKLESG